MIMTGGKVNMISGSWRQIALNFEYPLPYISAQIYSSQSFGSSLCHILGMLNAKLRAECRIIPV